jgi:diguanylate cyclase (GGDEF)-like protein/PAS domain S-box-containing protein
MTSSTTKPSTARVRLVPWLIVSLAVSIFVLAATFGAILYKEQNNIRGERIAAEDMRVSLASAAVVEELSNVRGHVRYLAGSQLAAGLLDATDERARIDIEQDWIAFARSMDVYDQLRLLDLRGREVLRINHPAGGDPVVAARGQLRDKSDRAYFRDVVGLAAGAIYVSPFDLNVEENRIEKPYKPVIRFATPVSRGGRALGVLVLNFRGQRLIDAARASIDSKTAQLMLLNSKGFWLAAPKPEDEWGFMFGDEHTLARRNPKLWQAIGRTKEGRFADADGVYLHRTIDPLAKGERSAAGDRSGATEASPSEHSWKLVSWIPTATFEARYATLRRDLGLLFIAAFVLVLPLAAYAAVLRVRRGAAERDRRLAARVFEATGEAMLVTDRKFRIIRANPAFMNLTGWDLSQIAGSEPDALLSRSRTPEGTCTQLKAQVAAGSWEGMLWFRRAGGGDFPAWASISRVTDKRNGTRNCILTLNDMTDRVRDEERARAISDRDPLTGLPTRRLLMDRLEQAAARTQRADTQLAILFINIDRFKQVNDRGGHDAGDAVLKETARRLTSALRVTDTAARLGADEFIVLLEAIGDYAAAQAVAGKIVAAIEQPVEFGGQRHSVGASLGIKLFPEDGNNAVLLLRAAEQEMRAAKARPQGARIPARVSAADEAPRAMRLPIAA